MEVLGHLLLFILAVMAMYGLLAEKRGHRLWRLVVAVPAIGALWFGIGGVLTSAVGFSIGAQLFLVACLYLALQQKNKNRR